MKLQVQSSRKQKKSDAKNSPVTVCTINLSLWFGTRLRHTAGAELKSQANMERKTTHNTTTITTTLLPLLLLLLLQTLLLLLQFRTGVPKVKF